MEVVGSQVGEEMVGVVAVSVNVVFKTDASPELLTRSDVETLSILQLEFYCTESLHGYSGHHTLACHIATKN